MSQPRYLWRQLTPRQREKLLVWRKERQRPWHSPAHRPNFGHFNFHISAACFEHTAYIGLSVERLDHFCAGLLKTLDDAGAIVHSWCVLPNHYHALIQTEDVLGIFKELGRFHGRTSFEWNKEEGLPGRKVFFGATDRAIRSERHFWATMNYVHNNAVHHGYVKLWTEWPWSSAHAWLESVGRDNAEKVWRAYPLKGFGAKWDAAGI